MTAILSALAVVDVVKPEVRTPVRRRDAEIIGYAASEAPMPALRPFRPDGRVLESALPNVDNEAWTDFVFAMKVAPLTGVSASNGLGMFDLRYKRLADLNLVTNLRYKRDPITNRSVQDADWVAPMTRDAFLKSANDQYRAFVTSCRAYARELVTGKLMLPSGVTASGALAILHRGGRAALAKWQDQKFESTKELFDRVNGVF